MQEETELIKQVNTIQAWWRGEQSRNKVRKLAKNLLKRKYVIAQFVDTQEKYIRDLSIIISDFKGRLVARKIITPQQAKILFSNVDQIRQLNELFFATIFNQAQNYSHYKIIFDKVEQEIPFFKMYFQYFNNFPQSNSLIDSLADQPDFAAFADQARTNPKYRQLALKDFLIKPVQRLPKYVLLMKQIKKYTPSFHPDFANVERVLQTFQEVNTSNNQKLNQVVNAYKVRQIQKSLLLTHSISQPGVKFIIQEPASFLSMQGDVIEGVLYLLSTELIVARRGERGRNRVLSSVPFKHGGEIMYNQQHFYYKNSFTVQNGQGDSCTLVFQTDEQKQLLLQKIYHQIMKAQQKNLQKLASLCHIQSQASKQFLLKMNRLDLLPEVDVLGTQQRNNSMFKYTIYIIEVKIKSIRQKLFYRFSQLLEIQELAEQHKFRIKNQLLKTTWLLNHKPRKIQERKMNIQRFLKELLSKEEVVQNGETILKALGLPPSFYTLPSQFRQAEELLKKSCISQRSTNSQEEHRPTSKIRRTDSLIKSTNKRCSIFHSIPQLMGQLPQPKRKSRQISIQDILQANEINLGHFTRLSEVLYRYSQHQKQLQFNVLIPWIQNERGFVKQKVSIACSQKVYSLIEQIAIQINLKYYKDFRLYLEREYAHRLLDDDECLLKIAEEIKMGKYLLILKKMIYLTPEIEEREIRADRVRLQLVASQAIYDCKKDKFPLSYSSILRLSALVGLSQLFNQISPALLPQRVNLKQVRNRNLAVKTRELVASNFTSFYDSPHTWQNDYQHMLVQLFDKIKGICRQNSVIFRQSGLKDEQKQFNTTNMGQLAAVSIINEIKDNPFHGSISFIVQISHWFRHILKHVLRQQQGQVDDRNCWLVIKYHRLSLHSINLKQQLFSFDYQDILKMISYPTSIEVHLRDKQVDSIALKTTCSYSIRQLILYYKHYNEMIRKMQTDDTFEQSMIELVHSHSQSNH